MGGLLYFARTPADGSYPADVLPAMLLLGVGGGLAFPALAALAMSPATADDAGLASGLFSTTTEVGSSLGLAVLAALVADQSTYHAAFLAAAAVAVVVILCPARTELTAVNEPQPVAPT